MQASAFASLLPLARVRLALGDITGAQQALDQARKAAEQSQSTLLDDVAVDMYQAWLWIQQGRLDLAEDWAKVRQIEAAPDETTGSSKTSAYIDHLWKYECLVLARLRLAQNQPEKALQLIELALPTLVRIRRVGAMIEAEEIRALALQALGKPEDALASLEQALVLGKPEGFVRTFIDEGEPLQSLLKFNRSKVESSLHPYIDQLLDAFSPQGQKPQPMPSALFPIPEKLSSREIEVLRLLQSPLSAEEIADELVISVSTARSHIKSIYAKLGVHSRIEAIVRSRELHIFT
jgi:LuxR family maltose regulon positive regulatory protein